MKIGTKVNLILIIVLLSGIFISGIALSNVLYTKAENEIASKALILMQISNSVRDYTNERLQPLLLPRVDAPNQEEFTPEAIPTYALREVFEKFRKNKEYSNFIYKDATLNPTNLRDKADKFEAEIVERFRKEPDSKSLSGFRTISGEKLFYNARPFAIKDKSCLRCHSTPQEAPKSQIATYGKDNGFGWNFNEIVAAQMVYVPAEEILKNANRSVFLIIGVVGSIFTAIVIIMNYFLKKTVLLRLKNIAIVAEKVSIGDMNAKFSKQSKDEIGDLAEAFNRMKYSLQIALNMLNNNQK